MFAGDGVEADRSSTPAEARVHFKDAAAKVEDPDDIEILLDPAQLNKSGASGDAAPGEVPSRRGVGVAEGRGGLRLWQRIRRQWRDFRFRFARRFSRMFSRRRYHAAPTDQAAADD